MFLVEKHIRHKLLFLLLSISAFAHLQYVPVLSQFFTLQNVFGIVDVCVCGRHMMTFIGK